MSSRRRTRANGLASALLALLTGALFGILAPRAAAIMPGAFTAVFLRREVAQDIADGPIRARMRITMPIGSVTASSRGFQRRGVEGCYGESSVGGQFRQ